jgi:hypothetical protein
VSKFSLGTLLGTGANISTFGVHGESDSASEEPGGLGPLGIGSVKLGVKAPIGMGEMGEGRIKGAELEDPAGLAPPLSCST